MNRISYFFANPKVVHDTTAETLTGFVYTASHQDAQEVYTDDAKAYQALKRAVHATVKHSVKEYVNGAAHINGMESFCCIGTKFWNHHFL